MKGFVNSIQSKFKRTDREKKILFLIFLLIFANLFLFIIKFFPSIVFESLSVRSDSFNSLGDAGYSIVLLIGMYYALKPADSEHPHGHERIKPFLSLLIAISIILVGLLIIYQGINGLITGPTYQYTPLFIIALIISILTKLGLYRYLASKGDELDSNILIDISKDSLADVFASTSALIGVIGAASGYPYLDIIFGLLVSIWIFKTGYEMAHENINYLVGGAPSKRTMKQIQDVLNQKEITKQLYCEAHYVGPEIHVYCELEVPSNLSLMEAHEIEEKIEKNLKKIKGVKDAYIHLEPQKNNSKTNNTHNQSKE
ncbi:cation diffusion facilitator family transporter [Methanonatronarchaeum sp. AMET6-2]|uniref:cation diffusion facilitator family transporter n=1 Tax=Methanonatronarchaeum sp. AMET6-2 TaxID=2933293 RepID=UPI001FF3AB41|nr:cation diffusion facilitator family transporter [Methanonatronarchaeum sp. AMET6-2]UOY09705.1 cation diffusion facilitator family transporter [Methanonatronarchaeum sp. AMET6-2]